jgi:DNA-binding transcriptional regulator YhcF (GntR family)
MYSEAVDDEKLRLLAFEDRWHFVAILCCKAKGILDVPENLLLRKVAVKLGVDMRTLEEVIRRLSEVGLIDKVTLQPLAWNERQFVSDKDSTAAERKRRERAGKAAKNDVTDESRVTSRVTSRTGHGDVTRLEADTEADTETKTEEKKEKPAQALAIPPTLLADFLAVRRAKRAGPLTATAIAGLQREADKAGISLEAAVTACCEFGWQGFNAGWYADRAPKPAAVTANRQPLSFAERDELARHKRYEEMTGRKWPTEGADVIDITPANQRIAS